jgi:hypothetical protein
MFKTSKTQQQTLTMFLQLYFGGLRFVSAGSVTQRPPVVEGPPAGVDVGSLRVRGS